MLNMQNTLGSTFHGAKALNSILHFLHIQDVCIFSEILSMSYQVVFAKYICTIFARDGMYKTEWEFYVKIYKLYKLL